MTGSLRKLYFICMECGEAITLTYRMQDERPLGLDMEMLNDFIKAHRGHLAVPLMLKRLGRYRIVYDRDNRTATLEEG